MKKKKHNCAQDLPLHLSEHCTAKENLPLPLFKRYYPSWVLTIQHTAIPTVIIMRLTFTFNAQSLVNLFCILFHNFCFFLFRFSLSQHLFKPLAENLSTLKSYPWGSNCVTLVVKIHLPKVALSYSSVDLCTPCCVHFYKAILCRGDTAMSGVDTVQLWHLTPLGRLPGSGLRCRR